MTVLQATPFTQGLSQVPQEPSAGAGPSNWPCLETPSSAQVWSPSAPQRRDLLFEIKENRQCQVFAALDQAEVLP